MQDNLNVKLRLHRLNMITEGFSLEIPLKLHERCSIWQNGQVFAENLAKARRQDLMSANFFPLSNQQRRSKTLSKSETTDDQLLCCVFISSSLTTYDSAAAHSGNTCAPCLGCCREWGGVFAGCHDDAHLNGFEVWVMTEAGELARHTRKSTCQRFMPRRVVI